MWCGSPSKLACAWTLGLVPVTAGFTRSSTDRCFSRIPKLLLLTRTCRFIAEKMEIAYESLPRSADVRIR